MHATFWTLIMDGHSIWVALRIKHSLRTINLIDRTKTSNVVVTPGQTKTFLIAYGIKALWIKLHALKTSGPDKFDYTHEAI